MKTRLHVTFLGTGTSHGIPVPACSCRVCRSGARENRRMRASIYITYASHGVLVDTATEFRLQAIANNIRQIDAVLYTHAHADHVSGFDDLRAYNKVQDEKIPCYGNRDTVDELRRMYSYAFRAHRGGGGTPRVDTRILDPGAELVFSGLQVRPLPVRHGELRIYGYLFTSPATGAVAYITDCSAVPGETMGAIRGVEVLILGALRYREHSTHFSLDQALDVARESGAKRVFFTHICHDMEHTEAQDRLPQGMAMAYDGLTLTLDRDRGCTIAEDAAGRS